MEHSFKLSDRQAQRVLDQFTRSMDRELRVLPTEDQKDIRLELLNHLQENMKRQQGITELEALLNAIEEFGDLENMVKPLVADRLVEVAGKRLKPRWVVQSIVYNMKRSGLKTLLFSVLAIFYVFVLSLIIPGVLKIFYPEIGLYQTENGVFFGLPQEPDMPELLGYWLVPISIFLSFILYILNIRFMRWVAKKG